MKFGIDVHGVVTKYPKFFQTFIKKLLENGHEVHIITGSQNNTKLHEELAACGLEVVTQVFSVSDYLIKQGHEVRWSDPNNPWFEKEVWDKAKGEYCEREEIDLHMDDSKSYGQYFKTPYMRIV